MGANQIRGEVEIELDGKTFVLRPSFGAIAEIRSRSGVPLGETFQRVMQLDVVEMATVAGACIRAAGKKVSDQQAGQWIVDAGAVKCKLVISQLLLNMAGMGADPSGEEQPAEEAQT